MVDPTWIAALSDGQLEQLCADPERPVIRYANRRWWQFWRSKWAYALGMSQRMAERAGEAQRLMCPR